MKKMILLAMALVLLGAACNRDSNQSARGQYSDGIIRLAGREVSMELALTPDQQAKGLSSRPSIEENQAMLFNFDVPAFPVFWMKDMEFPIDIVWAKGDEVVDISANVPHEPGVPDANLKTYSPKVPADRVIELKAGWASRNGLKTGDKIEIVHEFR